MYSKAFVTLVFTAYSMLSVYGRVCNDKQVLESKPFTTPSGHVLTMERFTCSNLVHERRQLPSGHSLDLNTKRDASQCTTANCICGVPCFFKLCEAPTGGPLNSTNCVALASSLINTPGTFTIPPAQAVAFILNDCEYAAFGDSATEATEYCFDDFGVAATETFDICGNLQIGGCAGTSPFNGANFFVDCEGVSLTRQGIVNIAATQYTYI